VREASKTNQAMSSGGAQGRLQKGTAANRMPGSRRQGPQMQEHAEDCCGELRPVSADGDLFDPPRGRPKSRCASRYLRFRAGTTTCAAPETIAITFLQNAMKRGCKVTGPHVRRDASLPKDKKAVAQTLMLPEALANAVELGSGRVVVRLRRSVTWPTTRTQSSISP
jgi:hypothetical protein